MIEIKGLYKNYEEKVLYQDFHIAFPKGKITTLLGPSGCGKTTLLRIIAGLEPFEKGEIKGLDPDKLSMVFQEDRLIPWLTVYENIALVLESKSSNQEEIRRRISEKLKKLHLQDYEKSSIQALSGGMKRRVSLARALVYDYDYLLMDEAFKGIDRALKLDIIQELKEEWQSKQKTIVLITHDREEAELLSDVIYELYDKPVKYRVKM